MKIVRKVLNSMIKRLDVKLSTTLSFIIVKSLVNIKREVWITFGNIIEEFLENQYDFNTTTEY